MRAKTIIPCVVLVFFIVSDQFNDAFCPSRRTRHKSASYKSLPALPCWKDLETMIGTVSSPPRSIDSVLDKSSPPFSNEKPTFFRERHGWCPYSERVWLALELKSVRYDTIRIDNTGGARPPYFTGQTPQLRWPDGRTQGESMDLIAVMDADVNYGERYSLRTNDPQVHDAIQAFRRTFPRGARPSSRAAFLFQANGDPLSRSVFQETLAGTEQLLSLTSSTGPFLCGNQPTAADICWAPFL
jgi:glutathione S-transferase